MMLKEFAPILLGFLLTTLLGGFLGVYLQQRSWANRFKAERATAERDRAVQVLRRPVGSWIDGSTACVGWPGLSSASTTGLSQRKAKRVLTITMQCSSIGTTASIETSRC